MQSKLTRRAVLAGVPAVAAAVAMPASGAIGQADAALDPIFPLCEQWREAVAEADVISARELAADKTTPASVCKALDEAGEAACARVTGIEIQIIETPATTIHGLLAKARMAWHVTAEDDQYEETGPDPNAQYGRLDDSRLVWFLFKDLERLAGGVS